MSTQTTITLPDDIMEVIGLLEEEKGRSRSAIIIHLIEKGISPALEEVNKIEVTRKLVEERKTKKNSS